MRWADFETAQARQPRACVLSPDRQDRLVTNRSIVLVEQATGRSFTKAMGLSIGRWEILFHFSLKKPYTSRLRGVQSDCDWLFLKPKYSAFLGRKKII